MRYLEAKEGTEMSLTARRKQTKEDSTGYTDDMGWGCTIRVGQMLVSNTLIRHLLIHKDFKYRKKEEFEQFKLHE